MPSEQRRAGGMDISPAPRDPAGYRPSGTAAGFLPAAPGTSPASRGRPGFMIAKDLVPIPGIRSFAIMENPCRDAGFRAGRLSCVTAFTAPIIVDRNPREIRDGGCDARP